MADIARPTGRASGRYSTREECLDADRSDPLHAFRSRFLLPDDLVYLVGNSLGPLPVGAAERAQQVVTQEWGQGLVRSWNTAGWFDLPRRLGAKLGRLIGADDGETVVTDTTTVNLFKALSSAIRIQQADHPRRRVVLTERDAFPTDVYIAQGLTDLLNSTEGAGYEVRFVDDLAGVRDALTGDPATRPAVVSLSHVNYRTGAMWPMPQVTRLVQDAGALMVWDLAHSAGAVPVDLTAAGPDFAVGCTYKYLNGGPGAPGVIWVHPRHQTRFWQPLSGWWSHTAPFAMVPDYQPADDIRRFLCGTQPVTSLALVETGLDLTLEAGVDRLRATSLALSDLFIDLVERWCGNHPLTLVTAREHDLRGSHVSYEHPDGYAVMSALIARGVIGDYREPHVMRYGLAPLYIGRVDVWDAVQRLREVLDTRAWDSPEFRSRRPVT